MTTETKALIAKARADISAGRGAMPESVASTVLDAVEALLTATGNQAFVDRSRVEDLEHTVRALATAVIAVTESASQAAPSLVALQTELAKDP